MAEKPDRTVSSVIDELDNLIAEIPRLNDASVEKIDSRIRSIIGKASQGLSPVQLLLAYTDWLAHLSISPARRVRLLQNFSEKLLRLSTFTARAITEKSENPPPKKYPYFMNDLWRKVPFSVMAKGHSMAVEWLKEADTDLPGMGPFSKELVDFINGHALEVISPTNLPQTNPEVLKATWENKGQNLLEGIGNMQRDIQKKLLRDNRPEMGDFKVGENLAITPGQVIYQNNLIELIQYTPTTETVAREPVLIVPAWIMKYYILDLVPEKSLVNYLVAQGKTVFMISWKNPDKDDRELDIDDYIKSGILDALNAVKTVVPKAKINATGYCIGGTLLAITAAYLAREQDDILNSITLLAAQTDFTEPGEIKLFLGASQLAFLDSMMWTDGYLEAASMGGAFKALRTQELVWNPAVERYYLGRETKPVALMAWNADGTRMPAAMHSRYLHELFVENRLASCKFLVEGKPVAIQDIRVPFFVVGTSADHVAPWKSVYKIHHMARSDITFLLTSGGHNAGIVSGPEHPHRRYQIKSQDPMAPYIDPDSWVESVESHSGSWWPAWNLWLDDQSSEQVAPPTMGAEGTDYEVLWPAPGKYVFG